MTGYSRAMKWQYLLAILLLLVTTSLGEFIVVTPSKPVVAEVGQDAVLGCQLVPAEVPVEMEVRWFREDWSKVVHLYRKGQDSPESQIAQYSGRTELFKDSFPQGNVSLLLKKVTVRDAGRYKCFVVSKTLDEEGSLQLQVASMGQQPTMKMVGYEGNGILVGCISEKWFPRPQVMWRDAAGQRISAHKESEVADDAGLLRVESVIAVSHATPGVYSCVIQNQLLGREYEGRLEIPDAFFPRTSGWLWGFLFILLVLLAVICAFVIFWMRKRHRDQLMKELFLRPTSVEYKELKSQLEQEKIGAEQEKKNLLQEMEKQKLAAKSEYEALLHSIEWERMLRCAVTVRLDPETANGNLEVYEDGTAVRDAGGWRNVTENDKRFERYPFLLGVQAFEAGKHYWEVSVAECPNWDLGVARSSVDRKGRATLCPKEGYWCISFSWDRYEVKDVKNKDLDVKEKVTLIGIFLNYDEGIVSFHDAVRKQKLHSFATTFAEPIYPFFCPWRCPEPLRITPVQSEE
ncbi:butyrophilin subfamily 2 member A1-like [Hypanus sabinus]|uniref:butyrophilin subfamily 2 member A1-like n=1 Tax=Hypanus sabinus TaxID=79690 RepID=UPI0028C3C81D|nr:butyrophilin subfamily 2 member A1-like [Hypanus sabinus]